MRIPRIALVFALLCGGVRAQDGGQDSPLEGTQGVRVLGMGGAGSAWLAEPSALWWNPSTLPCAPVRRLELQHTQNAFDTRTEHFALVFPTLDYGAWAVGAALQTTSDIQVTGDLSPAVLSTESFNRFRLGAAYGSHIPLGMQLGGTLKIDGYRFMGEQRVAWGFDIGLVPYTRGGFSTGLTVQNLIRPTFSYSDGLEDVWPRRFVLAAAFSTSRFVASGQLEAAQRQDVRFRLGGEYHPAHPLYVRVGFDGEGPTAGLGLAYGRFRIDYAFVSPSELGSEHRFGLTVDIGKPVETQRRMRAQKIDYEVGLALEEQADSQRRQLETEADTAVSRENWEIAVQRYAQLSWLYPEDREYTSALARVERTRDSLESARMDSVLSDASGAEKLSVLRDLANAHLSTGNWRGARIVAERMAELPGGRAAADSIGALAGDSLQSAVDRSVREGQAALAEGQAAAAAGWARAARSELPDDPAANELEREALRLGQLQSAESALLAAAAAEDTAQVLRRAQELLVLDPLHPLGQRYLKRYAPRTEAGVTTAEDLQEDPEAWGWYMQGFVEFRANRFEEAIRLWERVLERYPENEATRKNLEQARLRLGPSGDDSDQD